MLFIFKPYFILIQGILILLAIVFRHHNKEKFFLFSSKYEFSAMITGAIIIATFFNGDYQLFCNPVSWTQLILLLYAGYLIGHWAFKKYIGELINQLLLGVGLFISLYIIIFSGLEYQIWLVLNSIIIVPVFILTIYLNKRLETKFFNIFNLFGITLLLPIVIIAYIIWQVLGKTIHQKAFLLLLPFVITIIGISLSSRMLRIIKEIDSSDNKVEVLKEIIENKTDKYLTELILGAHWKYHTRMLLYDGWRPPYHDPVLGFAQPVLYFRGHFHGNLNLPERKNLYKQVFPENDTIFNCRCAENERL